LNGAPVSCGDPDAIFGRAGAGNLISINYARDKLAQPRTEARFAVDQSDQRGRGL
jgi:hypothetical protein